MFPILSRMIMLTMSCFSLIISLSCVACCAVTSHLRILLMILAKSCDVPSVFWNTCAWFSMKEITCSGFWHNVGMCALSSAMINYTKINNTNYILFNNRVNRWKKGDPYGKFAAVTLLPASQLNVCPRFSASARYAANTLLALYDTDRLFDNHTSTR